MFSLGPSVGMTAAATLRSYLANLAGGQKSTGGAAGGGTEGAHGKHCSSCCLFHHGPCDRLQAPVLVPLQCAVPCNFTSVGNLNAAAGG